MLASVRVQGYDSFDARARENVSSDDGPREPGTGANVFRRPPTRRDILRLFVQVDGSPFDSARLP
jgi:hypothetical protein